MVIDMVKSIAVVGAGASGMMAAVWAARAGAKVTVYERNNRVGKKILATGKGHVAQKIIEEAKKADVPFYKDSKLADTLSRLEIGEAIPPELYEVVAEILVFVDDMDKVKSKLQGAGKL